MMFIKVTRAYTHVVAHNEDVLLTYILLLEKVKLLFHYVQK